MLTKSFSQISSGLNSTIYLRGAQVFMLLNLHVNFMLLGVIKKFCNKKSIITSMDGDLIGEIQQFFSSSNCLDLNKLPKEDDPDDMGAVEVSEDGKSIGNETQPFVGQCFPSEEEAFIFYKTYANRHGFSIRKGRFVNKNGEIARRDFFCHREGKQPLKITKPSLQQRKRKSAKCECKAHLRIALQKSCNVSTQEWHVTKFVADHNHDLFSPFVSAISSGN